MRLLGRRKDHGSGGGQALVISLHRLSVDAGQRSLVKRVDCGNAPRQIRRGGRYASPAVARTGGGLTGLGKQDHTLGWCG
jgi:hypothetical protein